MQSKSEMHPCSPSKHKLQPCPSQLQQKKQKLSSHESEESESSHSDTRHESSSSTAKSKESHKFKAKRACRVYNRTGKCEKTGKCRFRHRCEHCKGDHPRLRCMVGRQPPSSDKASSQVQVTSTAHKSATISCQAKGTISDLLLSQNRKMAGDPATRPKTCIVDMEGPDFVSDQQFGSPTPVGSFMMHFDRLNPDPPPPGFDKKKRKRRGHEKDICYEFLMCPRLGRREKHYYMVDVCVYDVNNRETALHLSNSLPPHVVLNLNQQGRRALSKHARTLGLNLQASYDPAKPQSFFFEQLKNTLKDYSIIIYKGGQIERAFVQQVLGSDQCSRVLIDLNNFDVCPVAHIPDHYKAMVPGYNKCKVHSVKSKRHCPHYETSVFAIYIRQTGVLDRIYTSIQTALEGQGLEQGKKKCKLIGRDAGVKKNEVFNVGDNKEGQHITPSSQATSVHTAQDEKVWQQGENKLGQVPCHAREVEHDLNIMKDSNEHKKSLTATTSSQPASVQTTADEKTPNDEEKHEQIRGNPAVNVAATHDKEASQITAQSSEAKVLRHTDGKFYGFLF